MSDHRIAPWVVEAQVRALRAELDLPDALATLDELGDLLDDWRAGVERLDTTCWEALRLAAHLGKLATVHCGFWAIDLREAA